MQRNENLHLGQNLLKGVAVAALPPLFCAPEWHRCPSAMDLPPEIQIQRNPLREVHRIRPRNESDDAIRSHLAERPFLTPGKLPQSFVLGAVEDVVGPGFRDAGQVLVQRRVDGRLVCEFEAVTFPTRLEDDVLEVIEGEDLDGFGCPLQ